jgi:hypothetical protein
MQRPSDSTHRSSYHRSIASSINVIWNAKLGNIRARGWSINVGQINVEQINV